MRTYVVNFGLTKGGLLPCRQQPRGRVIRGTCTIQYNTYIDKNLVCDYVSRTEEILFVDVEVIMYRGHDDEILLHSWLRPDGIF